MQARVEPIDGQG